MDAILEILSRGFEQLIARADGPLHFRLVVMPTVVTLLAIRAHLRDVRAGNPIFLGAFLTSPTERRRLFRSGLKDFGRVFIIACVLDTTYQLLVLRTFYPGQMLIVAVVCALVPYFLVRGPVMRLAHLLHRRWGGATDTSAATTKPDAESRGKQESAHE
jgi:hypothetical protein